MRKKIAHFVCRQTGSIYPLIELSKLLEQQSFSVQFFTLDLAQNNFGTYAVSHQKINDFDDYKKKLTYKPDILFTGTSEKNADDVAFWKWANQEGIHSIAWLDQAFNVKERFINIENPDLLPRLILANDKHSFLEAQRSNIKCRLDICGSPFLSDLCRKIVRKTSNSKKIFAFASEPTPASYHAKHGLDHIDSYAAAERLIENHLSIIYPEYQFIIQLHPRDTASSFKTEYEDRYKKNMSAKFSNYSKHELLENVDCILGMRSMLLFEAASIGIHTISLQPHRKTISNLIDFHPNILVLETEASPKQLRLFLEKNLTQHFDEFDAAKFFSLIA